MANPDQRRPYPDEGTYNARIVEFRDSIRQSQIVPGIVTLGIRVELLGVEPDSISPVYFHVGGYTTTVMMLLESKDFWLGRIVEVRIKHVKRDGRLYLNTELRKWRVVESGG